MAHMTLQLSIFLDPDPKQMNSRTIATSVHALSEQTIAAVRDLSAAVDLVDDQHHYGISQVNAQVVQFQEVARMAMDDLTVQTLECSVAVSRLHEEVEANLVAVRARIYDDANVFTAQVDQLRIESEADIAQVSSNLEAQAASITLAIGELAADLSANADILHNEIDAVAAQALLDISAVEANLFGNVAAITAILTPLSNLEVSALQANLISVQADTTELRADVDSIYANDIVAEAEIALLMANVSQVIHSMSTTVSSLFAVL